MRLNCLVPSPGLLLALRLVVSSLHAAPGLNWIALTGDGRAFVEVGTGEKFVAWGFNYDRDSDGRLLEDYWENEWPTVEEHFREMKEMGANVVRVHLQLGKFMSSVEQPNTNSLGRLEMLVALAERTGLYLNITGLGCYHKADVPGWYDRLSESGRWRVQAHFWEAVAQTCRTSPAVFCYDLMNEPILPGDKPETEWLAGELAGKYYVQRISLSLAGRTQQAVAKAWVDELVAAIREHDPRHLVTVGVIPWALVFPGAKPLFYSKSVGEHLDFVSVHFYPEKSQVDRALKALAVYQVGKPLVIEEMFPLKCSVEELDTFVTRSRTLANGWLGFYWGSPKTPRPGNEKVDALTRAWLEYFRRKTPAMMHTDGR